MVLICKCWPLAWVDKIQQDTDRSNGINVLSGPLDREENRPGLAFHQIANKISFLNSL